MAAKIFRVWMKLKNGKEKTINAHIGGFVGEPTDEDVLRELKKYNVYPDAVELKVVSASKGHGITTDDIVKRTASSKVNNPPAGI